ncbi:MAG TPA: hypothetical protein VNJ05_01255 [Sphingomicrobium sp.]|nr:hypothetical protein [Sphingomicrobium sp.]
MRTLLLAILLVTAMPACAEQPAGTADPNVRIFNLPGEGRVHDVAPAPDGKIWYTGQRQGTLGIIDPKSGDVREVPLGDGSAPHGVIQGPDGAAWITDSGLNAIVRFDPKTEKITVWKLPGDKPKAYAVYVDERDIVWVTDFAANATLTFDPKTEQWTSIPGSGPDANVRQILGRPGEVYLPESGTNRVVLVRTAKPQ